MSITEDITKLLDPIKKVDFKIYSLESTKSIFRGERFHLTEVTAEELFQYKIQNVYWQVNNETFGEYCRSTLAQFVILKSKLHEISVKSTKEIHSSIISYIDNIIQNDSQIRDYVSIYYANLFKEIQNKSYDGFLKNSIDRIFDFRQRNLKLCRENIQHRIISETNPNNLAPEFSDNGKQTYPFEYDVNQIPYYPIDEFENPPIEQEDDQIDQIDELTHLTIKEVFRDISDGLSAQSCLSDSESVSNGIGKSEGNKVLGTHGFRWNKKRDLTRDTVILHTYLREHEFIHNDTPINSLKHAFSGEFIKEPLEIRWTKKVKGKNSKGLLFHFVEQLEHLNFIDVIYQNNELFCKLETVFCDSNGENLQNLAVSKSQWLNQRKSEKTPQEIELDSILYTLLYSDSNKSIK